MLPHIFLISQIYSLSYSAVCESFNIYLASCGIRLNLIKTKIFRLDKNDTCIGHRFTEISRRVKDDN